MLTKKTLIILTTAVIFVVLVYLFLNKQETDKQIITSTTTIPLIKKIDSNTHEMITIGIPTISDIANTEKTTKTKHTFNKKNL